MNDPKLQIPKNIQRVWTYLAAQRMMATPCVGVSGYRILKMLFAIFPLCIQFS